MKTFLAAVYDKNTTESGTQFRFFYIYNKKNQEISHIKRNILSPKERGGEIMVVLLNSS